MPKSRPSMQHFILSFNHNSLSGLSLPIKSESGKMWIPYWIEQLHSSFIYKDLITDFFLRFNNWVWNEKKWFALYVLARFACTKQKNPNETGTYADATGPEVVLNTRGLGKGGEWASRALAMHGFCFEVWYNAVVGFFLIDRILFVILFYFINTNTHSLSLGFTSSTRDIQTNFVHKFKTS